MQRGFLQSKESDNVSLRNVRDGGAELLAGYARWGASPEPPLHFVTLVPDSVLRFSLSHWWETDRMHLCFFSGRGEGYNFKTNKDENWTETSSRVYWDDVALWNWRPTCQDNSASICIPYDRTYTNHFPQNERCFVPAVRPSVYKATSGNSREGLMLVPVPVTGGLLCQA